MKKRFLIDRALLPYDAFVADESWLMPIEEESDGDKRKNTETDCVKEAGGQSGTPAAK